MDQQKTKQAMLLLGHYDIQQIEVFTLSVMLLTGHRNINQTNIFTSAHH